MEPYAGGAVYSPALIDLFRKFFNFLPLSNTHLTPYQETNDPADRVNMQLNTLAPINPNKPYDMNKLVERVADEGYFFELQHDFAKNIIIGF